MSFCFLVYSVVRFSDINKWGYFKLFHKYLFTPWFSMDLSVAAKPSYSFFSFFSLVSRRMMFDVHIFAFLFKDVFMVGL